MRCHDSGFAARITGTDQWNNPESMDTLRQVQSINLARLRALGWPHASYEEKTTRLIFLQSWILHPPYCMSLFGTIGISPIRRAMQNQIVLGDNGAGFF